ncbi:MAG: SIR2 family protein [Bacilli bacterium]|nr:SIR2 family protein [Bacilli bacterium]
MTKKTKIDEFIKKYAHEIKDCNAAIFLGSGLSSLAGYPSWAGLLQEEAKKIKLDVKKEINDLPTLAQYIENVKKRKSLSDKIKTTFSNKMGITETHKILSSLPIAQYWTTNYDSLIEDTFEFRNTKTIVYTDEQNLAQKQGDAKVFIYKMHGTYTNPNRAIITKTDYEKYFNTHEMFLAHFKASLSNKTFLFIGYSFSDINISYVLSRIKNIYKANRRDHYWIFEKPKQESKETNDEFKYKKRKYQLFKSDITKYGINLIEVDSYDEINGILERIRKHVNNKNILISGAIEKDSTNYQEVCDLAEKISKRLIVEGYKIFTGFGKGIGSYVINGAFEGCTEKGYDFNDNVKVFPFPYNVNLSVEKRKEQYTKLRSNMIAPTCKMIVLCGQKYDKNNNLIDSPGVLEEYEISKNQGNQVVPIIASGGAAKTIAQKENCLQFNNLEKIDDLVYSILDLLK